MVYLTRNIYTRSARDGSLIDTITERHIYSANGHFERDEKRQGWHIQLGSADSEDNYTEVLDGSSHDVPDHLDDITEYVEVEPEPEEDATEEDYQNQLERLGVNFE